MITALENNADIINIVAKLQANFQATENKANTTAMAFMNTQIDCLSKLNTQEVCTEYDEKRHDAIVAILEEANAFSTYQYGNYFKNHQEFVSYLKKERNSLEAKSNRVEALLGVSSPYLGGFLDDSQLAVANLTLASRDQQWLQFDYDHSAFFSDQNREATSTSIQASLSFHVFFFSVGGSYSYNKNTEDYSAKLAQSNMRVKGELLRVNIKRPWFKPELFEIPDITFVSNKVYDYYTY